LAHGLTGYKEASQFFPPGYNLHDPEFKCDITLSASETKELHGKKLEILGATERILPQMAENIKRAVKLATGREPSLTLLPLQEAFKRRQVGDYDIYFGAYGLDDPDPEGAMSFYFENENSVIPSGDENYVGQLDKARKEQDKGKRFILMRKMLSDSVCKGYVLPLFNYSTVEVGRPEVDFSEVPSSDETATLSKIRIKLNR
jgi:ABC-type oligopeptide transport system substrate-binding subunit